MRPDKTRYYLNLAEVIAQRSTCLRHKYGALLVKNDEIIATGYNGAPRGEVNCCDRGLCYCRSADRPIGAEAQVHGGQYGVCVAVHAEQNVLLSAARKDTIGADLYLVCLTPEKGVAPCNICDRLIKNAGILHVITEGAKAVSIVGDCV